MLEKKFNHLKRLLLSSMIDKLISLVNQYLTYHHFNRIVFSACTGKGETEMNAKDDLCLCLDIDKKSLFEIFFYRKYRLRQPPNVIASFNNMGIGIHHLLTSKGNSTHLPGVVLFQHPSPTKQCKCWAFMADSDSSRRFANEESVLFPSTYVLAVTGLVREKASRGAFE
jgi:hypothetical protein